MGRKEYEGALQACGAPRIRENAYLQGILDTALTLQRKLAPDARLTLVVEKGEFGRIEFKGPGAEGRLDGGSYNFKMDIDSSMPEAMNGGLELAAREASPEKRLDKDLVVTGKNTKGKDQTVVLAPYCSLAAVERSGGKITVRYQAAQDELDALEPLLGVWDASQDNRERLERVQLAHALQMLSF